MTVDHNVSWFVAHKVECLVGFVFMLRSTKLEVPGDLCFPETESCVIVLRTERLVTLVIQMHQRG